MRRTRTWLSVWRIAATCGLMLAAGCAPSAGDPATDPPAPFVGQEGKDVVWVPTPPELIDKMLEMAAVSADDVLIDLGSGDGRTVIAAARLGARAIGVEFDPGLVELSRRAATEAGVADRATFIQGDLFEADLTPATVITMFLLPDINMKLRGTLLGLRPGTRVVSNTWDMDDWLPDATEVLDPCPTWCTSLLWVVPARVEGTWQFPLGTLTLEQQFQNVFGRVRVDGSDGEQSLPIESGRLSGAEITFRAGDTMYRGQVNGPVIEGTTGRAEGAGGARAPWRATRLER